MPTKAQATNSIDKLLQGNVELVLTLTLPPNMKGLKPAQINIEGDLKKHVAAQKRLLESKELTAVVNYDESIRAKCKAYALPCVIARGVYVIPLADIGKLVDELDEMLDTRGEMADAATTTRAVYIEQSKKDLKELFNSKDYVPDAVFRSQFGASKVVIGFDTPETLKSVDPKLYDRMRREKETMLADVMTEIKSNVLSMFYDSITHLAERLTDDEPGKRKVLRQSAIEKVTEFIDDFARLNVNNDMDVEKWVIEARKVLTGREAPDIRKDQALREQLLADVKRIQEGLTNLTTEEPTRKIRVTSRKE